MPKFKMQTEYQQKNDSFIDDAERIATQQRKGCVYDIKRPQFYSEAWSLFFIAAMNRLTSNAGLRVLGPHDLV